MRCAAFGFRCIGTRSGSSISLYQAGIKKGQSDRITSRGPHRGRPEPSKPIDALFSTVVLARWLNMPRPQATIGQVTPFQQNCCLLWDSENREAAIVDPAGMSTASLKRSRRPVTPRQILLTHGKIDHAGGADESATAGDSDCRSGEEDKFLLDSLAEVGRGYGMEGVRNCLPSRFLKHGEEVTVGGLRFEVRACPAIRPAMWCSSFRSIASRWSAM